jgi:hypothetical protein
MPEKLELHVSERAPLAVSSRAKRPIFPVGRRTIIAKPAGRTMWIWARLTVDSMEEEVSQLACTLEGLIKS